MNRQTGAPVLGGRVARQPGEGVVLLQNKSGMKEENMEMLIKLGVKQMSF